MARPDTLLNLEKNLTIERAAESGSELVDGGATAVTASNYVHNLIVANIIGSLWGQLRGTPCAVIPPDLKVKAFSEIYTPDVTVLCDEARFLDDRQDVLLNPTLIVEVHSEDTRTVDRGEKRTQYRLIDSLQDYILVSQDQIHVEYFRREKKRGCSPRRRMWNVAWSSNRPTASCPWPTSMTVSPIRRRTALRKSSLRLEFLGPAAAFTPVPDGFELRPQASFPEAEARAAISLVLLPVRQKNPLGCRPSVAVGRQGPVFPSPSHRVWRLDDVVLRPFSAVGKQGPIIPSPSYRVRRPDDVVLRPISAAPPRRRRRLDVAAGVTFPADTACSWTAVAAGGDGGHSDGSRTSTSAASPGPTAARARPVPGRRSRSS